MSRGYGQELLPSFECDPGWRTLQAVHVGVLDDDSASALGIEWVML